MGGVLSIITGELIERGVARRGGRIGFAVAGDHAEEVFAVGEHVGIEGDGVVVRVGAQELPLGFVFAAEVDVVDQAVAIGVFADPGERDLLRGGAR